VASNAQRRWRKKYYDVRMVVGADAVRKPVGFSLGFHRFSSHTHMVMGRSTLPRLPLKEKRRGSSTSHEGD